MLTLPLFGMSQIDSLSIEKITETERIIDKYSEKIADSFNNLVEKATPMAEQGFDIMVKLQIVEGILYLLFSILTIILWFFFFKYYKIAKKDNDYWVDGKFGGVSLILLIFSTISTIVSIPLMYHGVLKLFLPEVYAIKEILYLIN